MSAGSVASATAASASSTASAQASANVNVQEDGEYSDKDSVALYVHTYGHLPSNFISRTKARNAVAERAPPVTAEMFGRMTAATIPRIATTIRSSSSVNALRFMKWEGWSEGG